MTSAELLHYAAQRYFPIGQIALVVMERPIIQWDPELYRSVGLEPSDAQIVVVKSPAALRAAYESFAAKIAIIDAPGVCTPNLRSAVQVCAAANLPTR